MRGEQTQAEARLWRQLRAHRFDGFKFKRQQPLGRFIVDFVCFSQKLIIEIDGSQHLEAMAYDQSRTAWLESQRFRVLRFWNDDVLARTELVLDVVWTELHGPLPGASRLSLSHKGRG
ncbi:MAG TPA: DUF559 domain-containing protein [Lysobacter sp.]